MNETKAPVDFDLFDLDTNKLDILWMGHSKLVLKFGLDLADAKDEMDRAKAFMEVTAAEVESEITSHPDRFGIKKVTVSAIKAAVSTHGKAQESKRRYFKKSHRVGVLQAVLVALDHRKKALENLVHLQGQQYFAEPRANASDREAIQEQTKEQVRRRQR